MITLHLDKQLSHQVLRKLDALNQVKQVFKKPHVSLKESNTHRAHAEIINRPEEICSKLMVSHLS